MNGAATPQGWTFRVSAGDDLQAALDAAQPGDTILVQAGATFVGNFILRAKPQTTPLWIVVRSDASDADLPPAGTRIQPSYAPLLPKLVSPTQDPALKTDPGASFYSLLGIELTVQPSVSDNFGIVFLGNGSEGTLDQVPSNLVLDRCYIHGNPGQDARRGVALNSARTIITECYIADFHLQCNTISTGPDAQAIGGWNGPGPFQIMNCYLEGGDETIIFGGVDPVIQFLVPSDIQFLYNYCSKPLSWRPGDPSNTGENWRVKNLFELKSAQRVLIEGNIFEHNWVNGDQLGFAILFGPRNQDGGAPWSIVQDVTFRNNLVLHSGQGLKCFGQDNINPSQPASQITVENNLFDDIDGSTWGSLGSSCLRFNSDGTLDDPLPAFSVAGRWLELSGSGGPSNFIVNHNTAFQRGGPDGQGGAIVVVAGDAKNGFVFTNNIAPSNTCSAQDECGITGENHAPGLDTLQTYFPGYESNFLMNILAGAPPDQYPPPPSNYPATLQDVGFVDLAGGDYHLAPTSPFKGQATDGTDPGCNIDALEAAISIARSGIRPTS
jgi:hypothetical protein